MNTYMSHMLQHAKNVYDENFRTSRYSDTECPFCVADMDTQWFQISHFGFKPPKERPERMPGPHCQNCPLISLLNISLRELMDDCVKLGKWALEEWENSDE